jgi:O-antigen ligase
VILKLLNITAFRSISAADLSLFCALSVAAIMPVYHWYLPPVMILWVLVRILELVAKPGIYRDFTWQKYSVLVLFAIFFLWQIAGLLYSGNLPEGRRNIELRFSLLLFPLVLFSPGEKFVDRIPLILRVFVLSNLGFLLFCFGFALMRSVEFRPVFVFNPHPPDAPWLNYFYAMRLAVFQHPSYLAMYTVFSAFCSIDFSFDRNLDKYRRYAWLGTGIALLVAVYFLSSKAGILTALIAIPFYFFRRSRRSSGNRKLMIASLAAILVAIPLFLTNPRVANFMRTYAGREKNADVQEDGRVVIWESAGRIIRENLILGVGTGDSQGALNEKYLEKGLKKLAENNYNAHNQFLEIVLENGIVGLILFIAILFIILRLAVRSYNLITVMFILIIFISFLFETMLNRLAGVSFFAFFACLLSLESRSIDNSG